MYTFPLPGWVGDIQKHWGTQIGGSDIFAPIGQKIVSISSGTVVASGNDGLGGNSVTIHDDATGLDYYYAHMRDLPLVKAGQQIASGTPIGFVGDTGNAKGTAPHLHLGIGYGIQNGGGDTGGLGLGFHAVAFLKTLLGGGQPVVTRIGVALGNPVQGLTEFWGRLTDPALWARVVAVVIGLALVIGGVLLAFGDELASGAATAAKVGVLL